jgi:LysM repeat protein
MEEAEHRSPLRILAPTAVVVFGLASIIVIATSGGSGGGGGTSTTKLERQDLGAKKSNATSRRQGSGALPQGTYIVKRNDTFGSIADKTGIPVERLQELNPDVDPQTLHEGEKIKLR